MEAFFNYWLHLCYNTVSDNVKPNVQFASKILMPRQSRHKNVSFSNIYSLHEICVYQIIRKYTYKGVYFVIDDKFIIILKKFPDKYTPINLYTTIQYRTTQHSIKEAINESINRWRWCHHAYLCNITCNDALPSLLLHAIY